VRRRWILLITAVLVADVVIVIGWWRNWRERRYDSFIVAAARRYGVDPALVKAVVWRESSFHADARGKAGELGLMQIREPAAREWAEAERLTGFAHSQFAHPAPNTLAGTWYLSKLLKRYPRTDNPVAYALADYNAGRANVLKWMNGPASTNSAAFLNNMTFPGTRRYVVTVLDRRDHYRAQFPKMPASE
jgi:soluble lytic murein transglycosylase